VGVSLSNQVQTNEGMKMKLNSIWKNIALLTFGTVFALHIQMSYAQDDTSTIKTSTGDEECVIKDDQL